MRRWSYCPKMRVRSSGSVIVSSSKGGTEHPMKLYVAFRGHKPETRALIEKMGLGK